MLGEPSLESLMRFHLKTQKLYGVAPFAYLPNEDKMKTNKIAGSPTEILKIPVHLLIITGLWLQMYSVDKSKVDRVEQLECVCFAVVFTGFWLAKQTIFWHGGHVVEIYNLFAAFEQSCLKGKNIFLQYGRNLIVNAEI